MFSKQAISKFAFKINGYFYKISHCQFFFILFLIFRDTAVTQDKKNMIRSLFPLLVLQMWNVTVGGDAAAQGNHTITQSLNFECLKLRSAVNLFSLRLKETCNRSLFFKTNG